jgi:hypothetical protein
MFSNKKAVSEIITYVLVLSIIVISSIIVYTYSNEKLNEKINDLDYNNMYFYLKKAKIIISEIDDFEGSTKSLFLSFKSGLLKFENNQIIYISNLNYEINFCDFDLCEYVKNQSQILYTNISSGYTFKENISLEPDLYQVIFINLKNESKIKVVIK